MAAVVKCVCCFIGCPFCELRSSVIFRQKYGGERAVGLGYQPKSPFGGAVGGKQAEAMCERIFVFAGVFRANVAPVSCGVASKGFVAGDGVKMLGGVGGDDNLSQRGIGFVGRGPKLFS